MKERAIVCGKPSRKAVFPNCFGLRGPHDLTRLHAVSRIHRPSRSEKRWCGRLSEYGTLPVTEQDTSPSRYSLPCCARLSTGQTLFHKEFPVCDSIRPLCCSPSLA